MSSTRTAEGDSDFHQERFASSPEFERGLNAGRVASRCSILGDKADREIIWFAQHLSHQPGGLTAVATDLLKKFPHRIGTPTMMKSKSKKNFSAAEVAAIRQEIPRELRRRFPMRGETQRDISAISDSNQYLRNRREAENSRRLRDMADVAFDRYEMIVTGRAAEIDAADAQERESARKHPVSYPVQTFRDLCRRVAEQGSDADESISLKNELSRLCLDPACGLHGAGPWYFSDLVNVLREHHQQWIAEKSKVAITTLGKKVCDGLDYCSASRSLVVMEGNARLGKSFAARSWVEQHPGKARFMEVPWGNDEKSFFHALARGLGLGSFLNYKVVEIRQRVESVLLSGDILLVMDEGQRLFPQRNFRCAFPGRVVWVMTMANAGVPIFVISTPQFILSQKAMEKTGWNSAQLTGRIGHYEFLPTELTLEDLMLVGQAVLPEASEEVLEVLASYARVSARYLSAVDSIAKRAQFIAQRNSRAQCTAGDVRTAMQESVIPSDTMLVRKLEQAKNGCNRRSASSAPEMVIPEQTHAPRTIKPAAEIGTDIPRRAGDVLELVKG